MPKQIDWLSCATPSPAEIARMYDITGNDPTERRYFFDPVLGDLYCQLSSQISDFGRIEWQVSLQTFASGEVCE